MKTRQHNFIIKKSNKGWGIYAGRNYKKGEFVWELLGKKILPKNVKLLMGGYREDLISPLQIGPALYYKLDKPSYYFNHSCDPNTGMRHKSSLFALKNIKRGQELTFDYSTTIDESFVCECGSPKCHKGIFDFLALPIKRQRYYFINRALPDFIVKKMVKVNKNFCPCGSGKKYKKCHGK